MNFPKVFKSNARIYHQMLIHLQVNFSNDFQFAFLQQVVIGQNTSGNGIFYGHESAVTQIMIISNLHHIAKSGATNYFHIISKKPAGRSLVEAAFETLYSYFFVHKTKIPAICAGIFYCYSVISVFNKALPAYF
jgi:hypothetical protein